MSQDEPGFSLEQFRAARAVLEAIVRDRGLLAGIPEEELVPFLMAAGRVSRPTRLEVRKQSRSQRRHVRKEKQHALRSAREATEIREARRSPVYVPPAPRGDLPAPVRRLERPQACYVCKQDYTDVHFFYDSMCPACADFNYRKRFQSCSLEGRTAVITGARVKIGYQASLKMLRAGARVIATTRFPHDAASRYAREEDFDAWKDRLRIYGLDLRHSPSVELLARHLVRSEARLDIIVNNAAQTVRRPPGFYAHLLEQELKALEQLPASVRPCLADWSELRRELTAASSGEMLPARQAKVPSGILDPARLSQLRTATDGEDGFAVFPAGEIDVDLQQVDLRPHNSWRMTLAEVPTWEMLEVHLVNAVAPFILTARLKPLMLRHRTGDKHVVQVSAMEGVFSRGTKTDKHPHTNMAKAALNMLVLTAAPDYARDGIHMNAVDTGWVTDEDPAPIASRKRDELGFQPPLDIVDGAARVCDPFFSGLITGQHLWGKFLKDYAPAAW